MDTSAHNMPVLRGLKIFMTFEKEIKINRQECCSQRQQCVMWSFRSVCPARHMPLARPWPPRLHCLILERAILRKVEGIVMALNPVMIMVLFLSLLFRVFVLGHFLFPCSVPSGSVSPWVLVTSGGRYLAAVETALALEDVLGQPWPPLTAYQ